MSAMNADRPLRRTDGENAMVVELFRHNLWANQVMLDRCRGLTDAPLGTDVAGTYRRLDYTLLHLARAQGGYAMTLGGWHPGPEHDLDFDAPFPGIDHITDHLRLTGERLVKVARHSSADRVLEGTWAAEAIDVGV